MYLGVKKNGTVKINIVIYYIYTHLERDWKVI